MKEERKKAGILASFSSKCFFFLSIAHIFEIFSGMKIEEEFVEWNEHSI